MATLPWKENLNAFHTGIAKQNDHQIAGIIIWTRDQSLVLRKVLSYVAQNKANISAGVSTIFSLASQKV